MKARIYFLFFIVLLSVSCSSDAEDETIYFANSYDKNSSGNSNGLFSYSQLNGDAEIDETKTKTSQVGRKLIKSGNITFETENLKKTKLRVTQLTNKYGGYLSKDSENELNNRYNIHLTIRIPVKNFDSILAEISKGVEKFDYKQVKIKDVTEEFVDLESRLKNKKELEKRYLEILTKAKNVKEILEVEKEIGKLREDIESIEGRFKYLKDQISLSTLEVSFYKQVSYESSFFRKVKDAFKEGFGGMKSFLLYIVSIWPFLIISCIVIIFIRRRLKKKK